MIKIQRHHTLMLLTAALTTGTGVGCVSQQEYDSVSDTNMTYQSRLEELHQENGSLQSSLDRKSHRLSELENEAGSLRTTRGELDSRISTLQNQQRTIRERLGSMNLNLMHPETDRALSALAAANPKLIAYDGQTGMIRFTSDLTFGSGSDVVKSTAADALGQLGQILADASTSGYEIEVIGHTDNQRISNANTRRNHPTNRHLSVHRAIAVSEMLQKYGVAADKVLVAGWGSNRPLMENNAKGGTAENRRVEIFVVMGSGEYTASADASEAASQTVDAEESDRSFPMK
jgi:flagellar motor protein MotB